MLPAKPLLLAATRFAVSALALIAAGAIAQPRYGLAPEVSAVFEKWVMATCIGLLVGPGWRFAHDPQTPTLA